MIGPTKLSTIRADLRTKFGMTDAELLAWFNQQMEDLAKVPKRTETAIDALRLLRDALVRQTKRAPSRRKARRATRR
jgi:hypothetical protein